MDLVKKDIFSPKKSLKSPPPDEDVAEYTLITFSITDIVGMARNLLKNDVSIKRF